MELKSRQSQIMRALLATDKGLAAEELLDSLDVGKRTLYYDIEKINDWLKQFRLGKVVFAGTTINARIPDPAALELQLRQGSTYFFSVTERRAMEIVYIALASEIITINRLIELTDVSKNTILGDIREVRDILEGWGLTLTSAIKSGYLIQGEEMTIRKMLGEQFRLLASPGGQAYVQSFLQKSLVSLYQNEIDFGELCRCLIKQYETDIQGDYILANIDLIRMMIQVSWIRSRKGNIIQMSSEGQLALMKSLSFRSVEFSLQKLRIHGVEVAKQESNYITSLFLGIQTTDFLSQEQEDTFIATFADELILSFERIACLSFPNRERLQRQLSHHIRPMYYRIKYGIPDNNPLVKDIKAMYPFVFDFTSKAVQETRMSLTADGISEDELAYLCIYFVSNLDEKYLVQENADSRKVLIVGAENMAVAILMKEQLQDLFGLALDYRVISLSKLREWMLGDYALVVSLVPLSKRFNCAKIVESGPIITEKTQRRIMEILREDRSIARYDDVIQDIIERVRSSVSGDMQVDKMYLDLFRYFEEKDRGKLMRAKSDIFFEKIEQNRISLLPAAVNLQDALLHCCQLLRQGTTDQRLAQRMINLLQNRKLQTYRIQPDAVLVHFPLQGDANPKIDVCMAVAPPGFVCPDGEPARILIGLATKDSYSHWAVLEGIYRYFSDQGHIDGIKQLYQNGRE